MYREIKKALEAIPELTGKVFPVGFVTDSVRGACCCYSMEGPTASRSMSGKVHHWTARITADLLSADYDELQEIYKKSQIELAAVADLPGVITLEVTSPEIDLYAADVSRYRKRIAVALAWRD